MKFGKGELLVLITGILWGTAGLFIWLMKSEGASPEWISFLRIAFACLLMFVAVIVKSGIHSLKISKRAMLSCALLGIICQGIYNIFYSFAVSLAGVAISAVLLNTAPIFTAIFSVFIFRERISPLKIAALAVNVFGCMLAATGGRIDLHGISAIGLMCGVAAGLCYALTAIFGKIAGNQTNAWALSTWSYAWATLFLFIWILARGICLLITGPVIGYGFIYALIPTALAYILYYKGVHLVRSVSSVPVLASLESVVAVIIGVFALSEKIGPVHVIGIILILFSLFIQNKREKLPSVN